MAALPVTNLGSSSESKDTPVVMRTARLVSLLPVPYISQLEDGAKQHNNDCGAATGLMLLRAYQPNNPLTVDEFYNRANPPDPAKPENRDAFLSVSQIQKVLLSQGMHSTWSIGLNVNNILDTLKSGKPLMLLINYGFMVAKGLTEIKTFKGAHFAVVVGMDNQFIYTHDPLYHGKNGEAVAYPIDVMLEAWRHCFEQDNPNNGALIPNQNLLSLQQSRSAAQALFRVRVTFEKGINIRCGPSTNFLDIGDMDPGDEADVFEVRKLDNGQEWGEIGVERWILLDLTEKI